MIKIDTLLTKLGMTPIEFVDFCIMCGTDYNKRLPKIGPVNAYKYILTYSSIENVLKALAIDPSTLSNFNYQKVRTIFLQNPKFKLGEIPKCRVPNQTFLLEYFAKHISRDEEKTLSIINILKSESNISQ